MHGMQEYRPRRRGVRVVQVTRANVYAVALEFGCDVIEEAKPSDPSDVALWLVTPLLDGVTHFLVTSEGPMIGREVQRNRLVAWAKRRDLESEFELVPDQQNGGQ